jgi:hypothetical protein
MPALVVFELQDMLSKAQDVTEHKGAAMYSRRGRTSKDRLEEIEVIKEVA